ncbi:putative flavoprotein involved in K+ transport [Bacillus oleivorans]|uniref:Putative flavoprotein involved in K+ transport n=1 Tax=Bacillus oleivorans TaxID=1448271 RepID=A0A285CSX9_9BACI|nr:NAD(P)/FAD-dependent oxidoreductase [Bacillus oleivorans]SNX70651.1 putative flavoprotein involved in K+ transport [Bacillus oleivorans]
MDQIDVVVVGAGQAGIAMGYYLKQTGLSFVLLDANKKIGESWRQRYDSLVLFTPRAYSSLPGLPMTGDQEGFPAKDEVASYLEEYVDHFDLPVMLNTKVNTVSKSDFGFEIRTNKGVIEAKQVVIASGAFQKPYIPIGLNESKHDMFQMHSSSYRAPSQIPDGPVLVVGGGNSGAQIAAELAEERQVFIAVSQRFKFLPLRLLGKSIFFWLEWIGLLYAGVDTKKGKWFRKQSDPIFGKELQSLITKKKIVVKPRVEKVQANEAVFSDKSKLTIRNIIWATGFTPSYDWIDIAGAVSSEGKPIHERGVSPVRGLYFIGLPWQYQRGSSLICGVARDAKFLISFIPHSNT